MVKEAETKHKFGDKPYLGFEHVTLVPMCRKLIDKSLLTPAEVKFLDTYHQEVYDKTHGYFSEGSVALAWLQRETRPL